MTVERSTTPRGASRETQALIALIERLEAEVPSGDEVTLELPISVYGGG